MLITKSGKKDSLVLCHDLFNVPRDNIPLYTRLLREEIWTEILPVLTEGEDFTKFNMVLCTDADSTVYKGAVAHLAEAMARDKHAIAACGLVYVELEPGFEWSFWNLYQQFQYTYGQYGRRSPKKSLSNKFSARSNVGVQRAAWERQLGLLSWYCTKPPNLLSAVSSLEASDNSPSKRMFADHCALD